MLETSGDKDNSVVAGVKLAIGFESEPLRPRDLDEIRRA
jgi:hypothetical protein